MIDHLRGCEGRNYTCTCGYDDQRDASDDARDAAIAGLVEALEWVESTGMLDHGGGSDMIRAALAAWEAVK